MAWLNWNQNTFQRLVYLLVLDVTLQELSSLHQLFVLLLGHCWLFAETMSDGVVS